MKQLHHLFHASILTLVLYVINRYGFKQKTSVAATRSLIVGALAFIYMLCFGHGFPRLTR